ncbi:MAG: Thioredoxin [Chlamydiales bacterium]|nr:Thioredoxin [Chlamydiales bacterium]
MAASDFIKPLSDDNFEDGISQGVVLVDFYADWCGPCRMLTPVVEELAQEMTGKMTVAKVDTDQSVNVAAKFEVTSIPTLILFKDGQIVKRVVGLKDLDALRSMVNEVL